MKLPIIEKESDGLLSKGAIISASQQEKLCSSTVIASQTSCHEKPVINLKQFIQSMPYQNSKWRVFSASEKHYQRLRHVHTGYEGHILLSFTIAQNKKPMKCVMFLQSGNPSKFKCLCLCLITSFYTKLLKVSVVLTNQKTKTNSKCRSYVVGKDYREIPDELPDLIPALHFLRFFINLRESYLTPVEGAEFQGMIICCKKITSLYQKKMKDIKEMALVSSRYHNQYCCN